MYVSEPAELHQGRTYDKDIQTTLYVEVKLGESRSYIPLARNLKVILGRLQKLKRLKILRIKPS